MNPTRAENKLATALENIPLDFRGKIVLDIGSSTGGFTREALRRGATKVIAIEKGTNQMKSPLRHDPRIELYEKTDIFNFTPTEQPDIILTDVSFISITKVLAYAKAHLATPQTHFFILLKPQFEAKPHQLKDGIVKNHKIRSEIIKNFELWLRTHNFITLAKRDSTIPGRHGNLERFYLLRLSAEK